ncbi:putative tail fiber protein [Escherichia phage vB_EcoS_swan01]|uniref:Putative tail fiber protein n=1 Tax=Escherichia phage vB_EcoS_swan01 TaxID=2496549 RepID=A0A1X7QGG5_9CAUD|nr:tail protein [Escherichia phage vB_EcoS_swan01]SMH63887.1 putative tail fiber protein [Escherichia phage vB_EcoS_swan01]
MAIYRQGQASMDAQGYVTGYGTKWREQLTLIRPGATIFFLAQPLQAAVITEVISDTSIRAITTGGAVVQKTNYLILLHDSLTVDGLAQDVAETLRYYQGKESEFAGFIEIIKDFDWDKLQKIQEDVKTNADAAAASQQAAKTSENNAKTSATNAANSKKGADTAKAAAESARDAANTAKTGAEAAKSGAESARDAANTAKAGAESARDQAEEYAKQAAEPYKDLLQPLPDVWIPFNDSLDMITGFSPSYKKIVIGDDEITMPGDKIVKFKRASTATYINKSGVLTNAAIDEPRFEKDGLLIEGQRTNLLINSTNPSKWNKSSNMILDRSGVDDFGFQYAKFTLKPEMVGQTSAINIVTVSGSRGFDVTGNEKYVTISCRAQSGTPNLRCRLRFENYDGSAYAFLGDAYVNLTDLSIEKTGGAANRITARAVKDEASKWIFFEATIKALDTENMIGAMVQYAPAKDGGGTGADDYIYIATPQVEGGVCASSFIITEATPVTRASDMVTIPIKNNLYNLPFTVLCEVHKNWYITPNAAPRVFDTGGHQSGAAIILAFGSADGDNDGFPYCDIGKSNRRVNENAKLKKMIIGMRVKSDYNTCCVSNARISSETKTEWRYIVSTATIRIGGQTSTGERHLFGHVRNFRIWHKALTDHQLGEIV